MTSYTIYFAGDLFDHKHLVGNAILAEAIERHSDGRYSCVLPQNLEQTTERAADIRNQDLKQVVACDLCLFNFDGPDLDSGTVVEFMMAKFLDIPSVILRTDFRSSGDQGKDGDAWNLMCSFYPRTRLVQFNGMAWYQQAREEGGDLNEITGRLYRRTATAIIEQLDAVRTEAPVMDDEVHPIRQIYTWAMRFPGGGFDKIGAPDFVDQLLAGKRQKKLL